MRLFWAIFASKWEVPPSLEVSSPRLKLGTPQLELKGILKSSFAIGGSFEITGGPGNETYAFRSYLYVI